MRIKFWEVINYTVGTHGVVMGNDYQAHMRYELFASSHDRDAWLRENGSVANHCQLIERESDIDLLSVGVDAGTTVLHGHARELFDQAHRPAIGRNS